MASSVAAEEKMTSDLLFRRNGSVTFDRQAGGGGGPVALWEMLYPVIQQFETLPVASRHLSGIQRHFEGKILNL